MQVNYVACKANGDGCMDETKVDGATRINDHEFEFHNAHCFKIDIPQIGPAQAIYYDVAALKACCKYIAFLLVCQNGICLNKQLSFLQKRKKISALKRDLTYKDLFSNLDYVKIPKSRKLIIIFEKMSLPSLIVLVISLKQWREKRN